MASTSDTPVLDLLATMTAASVEASTLGDRELMLVRIAALVAVDAPPALATTSPPSLTNDARRNTVTGHPVMVRPAQGV